MKAHLVDLHCHLDLYPDFESAVMEADVAEVYTLAVTTTPKAWPRNHEKAERTRYVRAGLGLHPQLVMERHAELTLWERYLPDAKYIGEIGLDAGPQYYRSLDLQKQVFEHILKKCAQTGGKILSVHSVRAATAVLDLVQAHLPATRGRVVLHWFTGSKAEAKRAVELGCFFSVNDAMTTSQRGRSVIATLPIKRLLTETDGPFTKCDGRSARPADVEATIRNLARLYYSTPEVMAAAVEENLRTLMNEAEPLPNDVKAAQ
jgi:TatD DNase family protein